MRSATLPTAPTAPPPTAYPNLWRPTPATALRLLVGLALFGAGDACLVASELGNTPWTVLAEGVSLNTSLSIGSATVAISFIVLLLWIPLRQRPGLGTVANAIVIGVALQLTLDRLPEDLALFPRWLLMIGGIALVAFGSGLYLTAALGPGPRDGLMTGFSRRRGLSLRLVRATIEISVLLGGVLLGGTAGIGTLAFALAIGPGVQYAVGRFETPQWRALLSQPPDAAKGAARR